jgi:Ribbon-helix-helix domain
MPSNDPSRCIEDGARRRLFDQTVTAIKMRTTDTDPELFMDLIEAAVRDVRHERANRRGTEAQNPDW